MQKACELKPSTMAAVIALPDEKVEEICASIPGVVVCANYNCPGQLVISAKKKPSTPPARNSRKQVQSAQCASRLAVLSTHPAWSPPAPNSPEAIAATEFHNPAVPVYRNVDAKPHTDAAEIKANLVAQLTAPVRWTQSVQNMIADGADEFIEVGPGKVLQASLPRSTAK